MDPNANPPLATLDQDDPMAGVEDVVTEDDTPVDNFEQDMQRRLLVEPLRSSWEGPGNGRPFLTGSDVGIFLTTRIPPLVPDALLSIDVPFPTHEQLRQKKYRTYFIPVFGKPPEVAIEIVSNDEGNEDGSKLVDYARFGVRYYAIFDPDQWLGKELLRVYELADRRYVKTDRRFFPDIGLGLMLWDGLFENCQATWLRWCDSQGRPIPTGTETANRQALLAENERRRADDERRRANEARQLAESEHLRADAERQEKEAALRREEKLRALLKAQGIDPDSIQ